MITLADLTELRRIATNAYDGDKACMNRIIRAIGDMERTIRSLKLENAELKKQLEGVPQNS